MSDTDPTYTDGPSEGSPEPVPGQNPEYGAADSAPPPSAPEPVQQSFKRRHWGKLLVLTLLLIPVVAFALWSAVALNWTYSEGDRPGYVQKIAIKGYVCKTWEGVLYNDLQGFRPDSFQFTVRSDSLARVLQSLSGKQVSVYYQQHKAVPSSCFGDSEYFVTGVRELK